MKAFILATSLMVFGCSTDIVKTTETKIANTRLSMTNKNPNEVVSMKRLIIDAPSNVIIGNEVKNDAQYGDYEEVTIDWGMLKKANYDFTYYLFTTDNAVRIDSVSFSDTLTQSSKQMKGALITKSIGMTGDGVLPIKMVNDTLLGNTRFWEKNVDTNFVMTIYGRDTLTKQLTKLVVKFKFVQDVNSIVCDSNFCVRKGSDTATINIFKSIKLSVDVDDSILILDSDTLRIENGYASNNVNIKVSNNNWISYSPKGNLIDSTNVSMHNYGGHIRTFMFILENIPSSYYFKGEWLIANGVDRLITNGN